MLFNKNKKTVKFDVEETNQSENKFERTNVGKTQKIDMDQMDNYSYLSKLTKDELIIRHERTANQEEKKAIKKILKEK
jgi:hypothetical protein